MGFNGDIVVVRGARPLSEFAPYVDAAAHPARTMWESPDGWTATHVRHDDDPFAFERPWVAALAAKADSPVLVCWVFETHVAHVQGVSEAGEWEAWLNPGEAAAHLAMSRLELEAARTGDDVFDRDGDLLRPARYAELRDEVAEVLTRARPKVAAAAVRWARAAGRPTTRPAIEGVLARNQGESGLRVFGLLADRLGVGPC
ncbi:hypothetical protein B4N89_08320 [Embleya scabrispora]|uniref:Uncharacterized protein n=1 Tax=Embleya scabrispora TaxID=159449 RepID=A0A1T3NWE8_9ACTN|nr:hypothetical protein [Embleya scabrispora]OPC80950.1 hypothetical protein B4N89_08320 [Embleya scabrispora]